MPTLYVDLLSQPARACYILCKANNLPVDVQHVKLGRREHRTPEYLGVNPLGKVPFLVDADLHLPESAAIMFYLADKYNIPQHWHPTSSSSTATLQEKAMYMAAVHWIHTTIRQGAREMVFSLVVGPQLFGNPKQEQVGEYSHQIPQQALKDLDSYWLKDKPFMTGQQVATPDLLCCCELEQLKVLVGEPSAPQFDQLLAPHPKIRTWMTAVRRGVGGKVYDEAHGTLTAAVDRFAVGAQAAKM